MSDLMNDLAHLGYHTATGVPVADLPLSTEASDLAAAYTRLLDTVRNLHPELAPTMVELDDVVGRRLAQAEDDLLAFLGLKGRRN